MIERRTAVKWIAVLTVFWFVFGFEFGVTENPFMPAFALIMTIVVWRYLKNRTPPHARWVLGFTSVAVTQHLDDNQQYACLIFGLADLEPSLQPISRIYYVFCRSELRRIIRTLRGAVEAEELESLKARIADRGDFPEKTRHFRTLHIENPLLLQQLWDHFCEGDEEDPTGEFSAEFPASKPPGGDQNGGASTFH